MSDSSEWNAVLYYSKGDLAVFHGTEYKCLHDNTVSIQPDNGTIRIPTSVNIERRFLSTTVTKEYETLKPWEINNPTINRDEGYE